MGWRLTPAGRKLYVANARSNNVSVIDTSANYAAKTISNVGPEPRGIAITNAGSGDDTQETVLVTQFLSLPIDGKVDGADDAKAGHVTVISAATDTVIGDIVINPLADTGFKAAGDALQRIAPPATPVDADFKFITGAYPNQLNNIAIRGKFAFVPNTGASPNGPVRFNVNTQSLLSVIDIAARKDAGKTINMHAAVDAQTNPAKRFITQPWAMAFKHKADEAYVVSAASNILVKLKIDPNTGAPTVQTDPGDPTRVLEIPTGKNPRGIVINSTDQTAYVMNYVSRDVTVVDLTGTVEKVTTTSEVGQPARRRFRGGQGAGRQGTLLHVGGRVRSRHRRGRRHHRTNVQQRLGLLRLLPSLRTHRQRGLDLPLRSEAHHSAAHRFRPDRRQRARRSARSTGRRNATKKRISSSTSARSRAAWA